MPTFQGPDIPLLVAATIDVNDLEAMAEFWSKLLGVEAAIHEPFALLSYPPDRKVTLWLQRVPEQKAAKNRAHVDFAVPDLEATEERIRKLGGSVRSRQEWQGYEWANCQDPEGNEFDVMGAPQESDGEPVEDSGDGPGT